MRSGWSGRLASDRAATELPSVGPPGGQPRRASGKGVLLHRRCALENEDEVRALEDSYDEAWNRGDVDALLACMTDDALIVDPLGRVARGRDEIRHLLAPLIGPTGGDSTHRSEIVRVEFVTPDIALVDAEAVISDFGPGPEPVRHSFTDVLVRTSDGWRINHVRAYVFMPRPRT